MPERESEPEVVVADVVVTDVTVEQIDEIVAVAVEADVADAEQLDPEQFDPEPLTEDEIARWELARTALLEVTDASTIGDPSDEVDEGDGVISYLFDNTMPGYPGWKWTVTIAQVDDSAPTVLETELTPADDALLAPEWVPWSDRMEDYRAAQIALGELEESDEDDDDESDDDESGEATDLDDDNASEDDESDDESDDDDEDEEEFGDPVPVLHAGDVDGVDIDELDNADADADVAEASTPAVSAPEVKAFEVDEPEASAPEADDRWAEPVEAPVKRARKPRRASSASIAQSTEGAPTES
jgi:hypothetical protein